MSDQQGDEHKGLLTHEASQDPHDEEGLILEEDLGNNELDDMEDDDGSTVQLQEIVDVSLTPEQTRRTKGKKKKGKKGKKKTKVTGEAPEAEPTEENNIRRSAFSDDEPIEEHAETVTQILVPVAITMVIVIALIKILTSEGELISSQLVYLENTSDSGVQRFFGSLLNAAIFVVMIVVVTVIFVLLYKYRCLKVIYGWLLTSTLLLLGFFGGFLGYEVLRNLNWAIDWVTAAVLVWNFSIVGLVAIFWHSPVKVNQMYLIAVSVIMALVFTRLPEWTTWAILAAIAIYDLFAVLCPNGPLRVLVETAQERNEPIPALVYNAAIWIMMAGEGEDIPVDIAVAENIGQEEEQEERKRGVKLGLGDFVFYSVLVGRAAMFDWLTVFTCFVAVITGLFFTILLLALWQKALPALPFSIALGMIFFFLTKIFLLPFATAVGAFAVVV